eukprot:9486240-Pyramimonas_sp.AAC.2
MRGVATFSRHLIGRRASVTLGISILIYRAKGCAAPRRAGWRCAVPRLCAIWRCESSPPWHPSPDRTDLDLNFE